MCSLDFNNIESYRDASSTDYGDINSNTTSMAEADMKSQTFVNTLNNNVNNINLSSIDSSLLGYTLNKWKLGSNGYPVFDWQE